MSTPPANPSNPIPDTPRPSASPALRGAISVFILFHLIAITLWALPLTNTTIQAARQLIRPYMLFTGLFQSWDMFAPNPKSKNEFIRAVVLTTNRHMRVYAMPRMEDLTYAQRYQKERYRKFAEAIAPADKSLVWPDMIRHIARMYDNPADPPDKVILIRFQSDIQPGSPKEPEPTPTIFDDEYIQPEDLKPQALKPEGPQ